MISRRELERLIVVGLDEMREAQAKVEGALARSQGPRRAFEALQDLKARAEAVEMLLGVLDRNAVDRSHLVAA